MLRILGAGFILAGCTGIGLFYKQRFHEALWHLRYMEQVLERFISEIRYDKATLPECCKRIGERTKQPYGDALVKIYEAMLSDEGDFSKNWKSIMGEAVAGLPLAVEEKRPFLEFADSNNMTDNLMQIKVLEQYRDMLDIHIKNREADLEKQGRMASGLGIMAGLLLTVILL
ncbi:MAG: stage III sporulation protein AB [Lachnospiraceae bacterium]|nr:stage III sporulation protein AB [Lachnospiraceae bacterium]MBQ7780676.1 stage III sporulation protein AB [Lachnospiraceae bacterium]